MMADPKGNEFCVFDSRDSQRDAGRGKQRQPEKLRFLEAIGRSKIMQYVPYDDLGETPNIIVDGASSPHTVITLSHWPHSGTPNELKDDLSTQIVFHYLDQPAFWVKAEAASNNHFDEDGLVGLYTLLYPSEAQAQRALLTDIAAAGDFGAYRFREAARTSFVLSSFADPALSPLGVKIFQAPYPKLVASLYAELLPRLPEIITHLERFRLYWEAEDALLTESEAMIRDGSIRIEESSELDLAVVTLPEAVPDRKAHRFAQIRRAVCHPMALHNVIRSFRVLLMQGRRYELQYRYESWVQYMSRSPLARINLSPLAQQLSEEEGGNGRWVFDGVDKLTPKLALIGAEESRIHPQKFLVGLKDFLAKTSAIWNPYDSEAVLLFHGGRAHR
jgi:hypothetical protein